jgi:hypothetical protein
VRTPPLLLLFPLRLLGHVWAFPNTVIALLFGIGGRFHFDRENRVFVVIGGWMASLFRRLGFAGMCIGDVVLCAYDLPRLSPGIYRHELVHATQSRLLGPLYLPLTLLGYLYGFLRFPKNGHDASPLEIWADVASGNAATNEYLHWRRQKKA